MRALAPKKRGTERPDQPSGMSCGEANTISRPQILQLLDPLSDRALQISIRPARTLRLEKQRAAVSQVAPQVIDSVTSLKPDRNRSWAILGIPRCLYTATREPMSRKIGSYTTTVQASAFIRLAPTRASGHIRLQCFLPTHHSAPTGASRPSPRSCG